MTDNTIIMKINPYLSIEILEAICGKHNLLEVGMDGTTFKPYAILANPKVKFYVEVAEKGEYLRLAEEECFTKPEEIQYVLTVMTFAEKTLKWAYSRRSIPDAEEIKRYVIELTN